MIKFAVLSTQRSGSNFLRSCLNSHPDIKCFDEVFLHDADFEESYPVAMKEDPRLGINITPYLKNLFDKANMYKAVGIDVKYNCLTPQVLKAFYDLEISVIHLVRDDIVKTAISQGIGLNKNAPIEFPIDKLKKEVNYLSKMVDIYSSIVEHFDSITVRYENLTNDGEDTFILPAKPSRRILSFLRIDNPDVDLITSMKKKNPNSLEDLLTNSEEVKKVF